MSDDLQHDLIKLRLNWLAANVNDLVARAATRQLSTRDIIREIAAAELADRQARSTERRRAEAKLGAIKPMADFDWSWPRAIDREAVERALALDFMTDDANVILAGPQGVGKTMIARNIAHNAVVSGHTALMTTAADLVSDLGQQETARALDRRLRRYLRPDVLVIDEIGYLSFDARAADLLFQVVTTRHESASIVMSTNLGFKQWSTIFPGAACLVALVDRLTHRAEVITIDADSFRLRESKERQAKKSRPAKKMEKKP
jgi:DNA replication protein DnaC